MQDYLRQQPLSVKNINILAETCDFLSTFFDDVSKDNIKLIIQVLQTLIEMSGVSLVSWCTSFNCAFQGNFKNQKALLDHHVVDIINHFLRIMDTEAHVRKKQLFIKTHSIVLYSLIWEEFSCMHNSMLPSLNTMKMPSIFSTPHAIFDL